MKKFTVYANGILMQDIKSFYNTDYTGYNKPDNPNYINKIKNTFNSTSIDELKVAINQLLPILIDDLPQILEELNNIPLTVCVVPRAKAEKNYAHNQLLFRKAIKFAISRLEGFNDGTYYIIRHTDTKTTHLASSPKASQYAGNGSMPYKGITNDTCKISDNVKGKNILLIDDIYTIGVNIDEDAIQALLDKGAKNVYFYAIAKTKYYKKIKNISNIGNVSDLGNILDLRDSIDFDDLPF